MSFASSSACSSVLQAPLPENALYPGVDPLTNQNGGLICLYGHKTSIKHSKFMRNRDCEYQSGSLYTAYTGFEVVVPAGGLITYPASGPC